MGEWAAGSEWWTYRPSDLLMFSPRTYRRLFETYNAEVWPAQVLALGVGLVLLASAWARSARAARAALAVMALCWLWVAWAWHLQRFATISTAAPWFAAAFAAQSALLFGSASFGPGWRLRTWREGRTRAGLGLLLVAVAVQPTLGVLLGRPWQQAEVFALAPDPTAVATLGVLLLLRPADASGTRPALCMPAWALWPIPLLWCAVSGATLATLGARDAWLLPAAALAALAAVWVLKAKRMQPR